MENQQKNLVYYLAYGSNMTSKVLTGRRKVRPVESFPVTVPGYLLAFSIIGWPYLEPCYASVMPCPNRYLSYEKALEVHEMCKFGGPFEYDSTNPEKSLPPVLSGVAHHITEEDWQQIVRTEGGFGQDDVEFGYRSIEVTCVKSSGETITARTLISRDASTSRCMQPTRRYLDLLIDGAKEHKLPESYIEYLQKLEAYLPPKTLKTRLARWIFVGPMLPLMIPVALIAMIWIGLLKKPPPKILVHVFSMLNNLARSWHDRVVSRVFGSGYYSPGVKHVKKD
ncbi:hypothetical protein BJ742DRAFT_795458 [Cladochytrium replicatum]|nr:hypothetical protein BJ742DRAFT_795458 [Cladochytrium replicatum]